MAPWAFVLAVPDIKRSSQYFRDVLGLASIRKTRVLEHCDDASVCHRPGAFCLMRKQFRAALFRVFCGVTATRYDRPELQQ
jgi:hypothetical protein